MKPTAIVLCPPKMNIFAVYRMVSTEPVMIIPAIPQTMTGASKKGLDDVISVNFIEGEVVLLWEQSRS